MRAVGVVLVILNHMWPWESYSHTLFLLVQLPWMMMDGFFVLSGFLITGILLDTRQRPDYYRSFYVRRALRILPIYYLVLSFVIAVAMLRGHAAFRETSAHWGSLWWFFVYLGNLPTALTGTWPAAAGFSLVPLWSLQIEEQFYLLFPFLIHRLNLRTITRVLFGLSCFSLSLRIVLYFLYPQNALLQYVLLPCRMEGLAMGAWMAIRFRQGPWRVNKKRLTAMTLLWGVISLATAAWSGFYETQPFNRTIGFLIAPIWFSYIIFWLIQFRGSRRTRWLRTPPLQYLGKVSYAAYLVHWPAAVILTSIFIQIGRPGLDKGILRLTLIYVLTFGFSALSWHFFENPLQQLKDRLFPAARLPRQANNPDSTGPRARSARF